MAFSKIMRKPTLFTNSETVRKKAQDSLVTDLIFWEEGAKEVPLHIDPTQRTGRKR